MFCAVLQVLWKLLSFLKGAVGGFQEFSEYTEFCRIGLSDSNSKDLRREHLHIWDVDVFELAWAFNVQDFAGLCYRRVFGVWELVNRLRTGSFCAQCYGR